MPHPDGYPTASICGSMLFFQRMLLVAEELTRQGYLVLMPFVRREHGNSPEYELATPVSKAALDEMHLEKINRSDVVVVVTDRDGYYGESTLNEIAHARGQKTTVSFVATDYDHRGIVILQWRDQ